MTSDQEQEIRELSVSLGIGIDRLSIDPESKRTVVSDVSFDERSFADLDWRNLAFQQVSFRSCRFVDLRFDGASFRECVFAEASLESCALPATWLWDSDFTSSASL